MDLTHPYHLRQPSLLDMTQQPPPEADGARHWTARAQNFSVDWRHAGASGSSASLASEDEVLLIVLDAPARIVGREGAALAQPRCIGILPPGKWQLELQPGATCVALSTLRAGVQTGAVNEAAYAESDPRIAPVGPAWPRVSGASELRIFPIDSIAAPADKPRLKMLQTATLSINWVEYEGPRDRRSLSPHAHTSFEQGSLALAGDFVHHLRVDWGSDAEAWQEDRHARLPSPSLMVVPVETIHTSEGVGPGHHLLIDVFSPPRGDFIAKGWVANAADYTQPPQNAA